ncbi:MAG: hypothetical protein ACLGRW_01015 [Acidobacteriota bacterium]
MSKVTVTTEKVGGGFFTLPAHKATAYENHTKVAEAYSKTYGSASEAREKLTDKIAEGNTNNK